MTQFVLLYILDKDSKNCYYILKDKPSVSFLNGRLTCVGGKVEKNDKSIEEAMLREIREELSLDLIKEKINYQFRGQFIDKHSNEIFIYVTTLPFSLAQIYIPNEGWLVKKPLNHHIKRPEEFPDNNPEVIEQILKGSSKINLDFKK